MGLLRRGTTAEATGATGATGSAPDGTADEDVYVVSRAAARHAAKAEKERRKAARADRLLAEARRTAGGGTADVTGVADHAVAQIAEAAAAGSGDKDAKKAAKKARKQADKDAKKRKAAEPVTGATVKRYLGIARVVVPVLAPLVYQAVGEARSRWDTHRARQLGVAPDQLADFSGRGAALYARIHHLALSVRDLRTRRGDDREAMAFADDARNRLADLEAAVRSAEQMPSARRRSAHAAVGDELDRVETRLLAFWGVDGTAPRAGSLPSGAAAPHDAARS